MLPAAARIRSLATAVPPHLLRQQDVMVRSHEIFDKAPSVIERLMPVYAHAGVMSRHSCVPADWYMHPHGWAEKNELFIANAVMLLTEAAEHALERCGLDAGDVDSVITVSTTGIATPSLDAHLINRLGLRSDVQRLPIFGLGCAGGVIGLARAAAAAQLRPGSNVLCAVVELCGLTFRRADVSKANVVATALFGDGAAVAILSTDGPGALVTDWGEHTWPESLDVMGWSVEEDGFGVVFSRDIPMLTRTRFADAAREFLERAGLTLADIDHFVCHPGGAKVLDALENAFSLSPGALVESRGVLRDYGNMSAATVLFVLERAFSRRAPGRYLLSALGPGFTAAFLLLEDG